MKIWPEAFKDVTNYWLGFAPGTWNLIQIIVGLPAHSNQSRVQCNGASKTLAMLLNTLAKAVAAWLIEPGCLLGQQIHWAPTLKSWLIAGRAASHSVMHQ